MSPSILLGYAITDVSVHPSMSYCFYIPLLSVVKGVCSEKKKKKKDPQAINEVNASEKESVCSLQLCHLKGTALRRDLEIWFSNSI